MIAGQMATTLKFYPSWFEEGADTDILMTQIGVDTAFRMEMRCLSVTALRSGWDRGGFYIIFRAAFGN